MRTTVLHLVRVCCELLLLLQLAASWGSRDAAVTLSSVKQAETEGHLNFVTVVLHLLEEATAPPPREGVCILSGSSKRRHFAVGDLSLSASSLSKLASLLSSFPLPV